MFERIEKAVTIKQLNKEEFFEELEDLFKNTKLTKTIYLKKDNSRVWLLPADLDGERLLVPVSQDGLQTAIPLENYPPKEVWRKLTDEGFSFELVKYNFKEGDNPDEMMEMLVSDLADLVDGA